MAKNKKKTVKKTKQTTDKDAWDVGWAAEQTLFDTILANVADNQEDLDSAFIAAFRALILDMAHVWKKEFLLELVNETCDDVAKDHPEHHVCNDCQEKEVTVAPVSKEVRNKMH
jgi:hypothetical protein